MLNHSLCSSTNLFRTLLSTAYLAFFIAYLVLCSMFPQQRPFCPGSIIWQIPNVNTYRAYKTLLLLIYECGQAQGPAGSSGYQALFQSITSAWLSFIVVWSLPCHFSPHSISRHSVQQGRDRTCGGQRPFKSDFKVPKQKRPWVTEKEWQITWKSSLRILWMFKGFNFLKGFSRKASK